MYWFINNISGKGLRLFKCCLTNILISENTLNAKSFLEISGVFVTNFLSLSAFCAPFWQRKLPLGFKVCTQHDIKIRLGSIACECHGSKKYHNLHGIFYVSLLQCFRHLIFLNSGDWFYRPFMAKCKQNSNL